MRIQKIIDDLTSILLRKKQTVSVAESVTSGNVQAALSLGENAALFLQGGITAYNIVQKCDHLAVDLSEAVATNCVSEVVASQMAGSVCDLFSSSWGIACTGYATPFPPHTDDGLFACIAIAYNGKVVKKATVKPSAKTAHAVQMQYTEKALTEFLKVLRTRKS